VDTSQLLSLFLKGAIGSKGRKRGRKAAKFLGGRKGFLSASTVLGAAGVAWGIYETMQNQQTPAASGWPPAGAGAGGSQASHTVVPPPLPGGERTVPDEMLRVVRLAVSAARADGTLLPAERALILSHARDAGVEAVVEIELASPRPLSEIVGGIADEQRKRDLYTLAFTIVRADESVSGGERVYLAQLAHQLGLAPQTVAELETQTAATIDAQPEDPQA
jgi:uncharacterized membrane protein YebE (DUF533 family)